MKRIILFLFMLFLPMFVNAAYHEDFAVINNETIWLGWTVEESSTDSYAHVASDKNAYGRYQFDLRYAFKPFIQKMLEIDGDVYSKFSKYVSMSSSELLQIKDEIAAVWREYAKLNDERFYDAQDEYSYNEYYLPTKKALSQLGIDINQFGPVVKGTIWSVAIRDGVLYPNEVNSKTYKALVLTYEEGINDLEYFTRIMDQQVLNHGTQAARWKISQRTIALAAMEVEDNPTNYNKEGIGGMLGGLREDPWEGFQLLRFNEKMDCTNIFMKNDTELNDFGKFMDDIYSFIKLAAFVIFLFLSTKDLYSLIINSEVTFKKVLPILLKRGMVALIIYFLPDLLELLFQLFGLYDLSNCDIG